jgi:hypothetical protein
VKIGDLQAATASALKASVWRPTPLTSRFLPMGLLRFTGALVLTTWAASGQISDSSWNEEFGESCLGVGR